MYYFRNFICFSFLPVIFQGSGMFIVDFMFREILIITRDKKAHSN